MKPGASSVTRARCCVAEGKLTDGGEALIPPVDSDACHDGRIYFSALLAKRAAKKTGANTESWGLFASRLLLMFNALSRFAHGSGSDWRVK